MGIPNDKPFFVQMRRFYAHTGVGPRITHTTEANGECSKPQVAIAKQAFGCMRQIMIGFGLDPQSRGKISVLPPKERDPIGDLYFKRSERVAV